MIVNETELLDILNRSKNVLLIEPMYKRKYVPLGLAKLATYLTEKGKTVEFSRKASFGSYDLICVTSLFTMDSGIVLDTIQELAFLNPTTKIIVGGVLASLNPEIFNVDVFKGCSKILDECVPDYTIPWGVEFPWINFSFTFTSRSCPNRCAYCAVWRIEPEQWIAKNWREHIVDDKQYAMISDNNLSSMPEHLIDVASYLSFKKKRSVFDNGLDCKLITKDIADALAKVPYHKSGLRLAFDRIEEDGVFQSAIELLKSCGVKRSHLMAYVLFNFNDKPKDADYRARECVRLGIRPYPQQYQPLNSLNRDNSYVGKYWTKKLRSEFRKFWLMAGIYGKHDFQDYAKEHDLLAQEDWDAWETT